MPLCVFHERLGYMCLLHHVTVYVSVTVQMTVHVRICEGDLPGQALVLRVVHRTSLWSSVLRVASPCCNCFCCWQSASQCRYFMSLPFLPPHHCTCSVIGLHVGWRTSCTVLLGVAPSSHVALFGTCQLGVWRGNAIVSFQLLQEACCKVEILSP